MSSTSSAVKCRGVSVPTWTTPSTRPRASIGTPRSDLIPFSRRIGFSTSAWRTASITAGRRPLGYPLEQVDVVGCEGAVRQRPHVDDADHFAAHGQRNPEQRLDPLLAQDRVEDVRAVDVVDHDRGRLRGDPAGEAPAERDADAALHLLLDPLRRAGD